MSSAKPAILGSLNVGSAGNGGSDRPGKLNEGKSISRATPGICGSLKLGSVGNGGSDNPGNENVGSSKSHADIRSRASRLSQRLR